MPGQRVFTRATIQKRKTGRNIVAVTGCPHSTGFPGIRILSDGIAGVEGSGTEVQGTLFLERAAALVKFVGNFLNVVFLTTAFICIHFAN